MKNNLLIIPARYKSVRFPGKPLAEISGKSMIQFIFERIKHYSFVDQIIVATDDENIRAHCNENKIPVVLTDENHLSGTDRVAEVAKDFPDNFNIINLQGDEPFIKEADVRKLIETLELSSDGIATLACPFNDEINIKNINRVKVVFNRRNEAMYFSRFGIPYLKNNHKDRYFYQHIGIYGFRNEVLQGLTKLPPGRYERAESLEQLRWLEAGYKINIGFVEESFFSIDTPEDLIEANRIVKILSV